MLVTNMYNHLNSLLYKEDQILGLITLHVTVNGTDFVERCGIER